MTRAAAFLIPILLLGTGFARPTSDSGGWKLVWSDEFNQDGRPDPSKWTYERGFVRNQELQWYQPENAWCEKGLLIIEGRRERKGNPGFQAGSANWKANREFAEYTSASLTTRGLASWQYGRFEMRARIDTREGMWPAFWSTGAGRWPGGGEIDIMEYYHRNLLANLIWSGGTGSATKSFTRRKPISTFADPDWSNKFHVWRMDWDENRILITVDGEVVNDSDLNQAANPDGSNGFRHAHSLILNLALGANGGDPSDTTFPARFEVDYVRIYQKQ